MGQTAICNKCGKRLNFWDLQEDFSIIRDLGYGTKYDGERLKMRLCCECMETLIDVCQKTPIISNTYENSEQKGWDGDC